MVFSATTNLHCRVGVTRYSQQVAQLKEVKVAVVFFCILIVVVAKRKQHCS